MSRTWVRAGGEQKCGGLCLGMIQAGEPMLIITSNTGATWKKFRCERCADEPVNLTLEVAETRAARMQAMTEASQRHFTGAAQPPLFVDDARE